MGRLGCAGLVMAVVHLGPATGARAEEGKDDALVGEWAIVGMVYKGKIQDFDGPTGGTIKIEDGKLWLRYPSRASSPEERVISLRSSKSPREIDLRRPGGDHVWLGIYELKDGTLRIIIAQAGDARPTDFEATKNERLILYTLAKPKPRVVLTGHTDEVYALTFSPDGKTLASAGQDTSVRLWDVAAAKARLVIPGEPETGGHEHTVYALAFSPDSKTIAVAGNDLFIRLYDSATGKLVGRLTDIGASTHGLVYTPDGQTLVSGSSDHKVRLWDPATGILRTAIDAASPVECLALTPDGKAVVAGHYDGWVRSWHVESGKAEREFGGAQRTIEQHRMPQLAISPDGKTLATTTFDSKAESSVHLWNLPKEENLGALRGHRSQVSAVAFGPGGKILFSGAWDGEVKVWDVTARKELATVMADDQGVYCLALSPDGKTLATTGGDCKIRLWSAAALTGSGK